MLNTELRKSINHAFTLALNSRHEFITVEHLLLALLRDIDVMTLFEIQGANIKSIRSILEGFITKTVPIFPEPSTTKKVQRTDAESKAKPTLGLERVMERATFLSECSDCEEVSSLHMLMAMFGEQESYAVFFMKQHHVGRNHVVHYIKYHCQPSDQVRSNDQGRASRQDKPSKQGKISQHAVPVIQKTMQYAAAYQGV